MGNILIVRAELEREMQKTISKIEHENTLIEDKDHPVELDVIELKKYIELVTKEVKQEQKKIKKFPIVIENFVLRCFKHYGLGWPFVNHN